MSSRRAISVSHRKLLEKPNLTFRFVPLARVKKSWHRRENSSASASKDSGFSDLSSFGCVFCFRSTCIVEPGRIRQNRFNRIIERRRRGGGGPFHTLLCAVIDYITEKRPASERSEQAARECSALAEHRHPLAWSASAWPFLGQQQCESCFPCWIKFRW